MALSQDLCPICMNVVRWMWWLSLDILKTSESELSAIWLAKYHWKGSWCSLTWQCDTIFLRLLSSYQALALVGKAPLNCKCNSVASNTEVWVTSWFTQLETLTLSISTTQHMQIDAIVDWLTAPTVEHIYVKLECPGQNWRRCSNWVRTMCRSLAC